MNENVLENLIQKINDMLKDIEDINFLVRRLPSSADALTRMNERIDATQIAAQKIEKSIGATASEIQSLRTGMESVHTAIDADSKAMGNIQTVIDGLPGRLLISLGKMGELKKEMDDLSQRLAKPLEQRVTHHHHVTKAVWVSVVLVVMVAGLFSLLIHARGMADREKENDIKYRSLKVSDDIWMERLMGRVDSEYLADPAGFRKMTIMEEERQKQAADDRREAEKKKEEWQRSEEKVRGASR